MSESPRPRPPTSAASRRLLLSSCPRAGDLCTLFLGYNLRILSAMRTLFSLVLLASRLASAQTIPAETPLPRFEDAAKQVSEGIESMAAEIAKRTSAPYISTKME